MSSLQEAARDFLACKRIAVAGVSRSRQEAANTVYRKLRDCGYEVFAVNPKATEVEGDPCYPDLSSIPGGVEAVVVGTHPDVSTKVVQQCIDAGIGHVWLHRSFGQGSVSEEAVQLAEQAGVEILAGGCPMMVCQPVDPAHRCMRWVLGLMGRLPQSASTGAAPSN